MAVFQLHCEPRLMQVEGLSSYQFPTAFVMAIIGIVDSIVAARENGSKYGYAVSANRDLVAMGTVDLMSRFSHADPTGAANIAASTLLTTGSVPAFGSITRESCGSRHQLRSEQQVLV